jgi:hypothetical protein
MTTKNGLHDFFLDLSGYDATVAASAFIDPTIGLVSGAAPVTVGAAAQAMALYLTEPGTTAAISVSDLFQGQIGDCFLISSIGELALTDPSAITNMIHLNANGTETVTLYSAKNGAVPGYFATSYKADPITVTNSFPTYSVDNGATQDVVNGVKEIWPQVLEKAVATLDGGYGAIANGGNPMIAMEELTGKMATYLMPSQVTASVLQGLITAKDMIVMDTSVSNSTYNLVGDHAYMFEKMIGSGASAMVQLGNPWGYDQPTLIPVSALSKAFVEVDIGHA